MILGLLSRRFRAWLLFTLLLPVVGRCFQFFGARVSERSPRVGKALTTAGGLARSPRKATTGRARRRLRTDG
jgi:hypothetical protein